MNWVAHLENKIATNKKTVYNLVKYVVYFKKYLLNVKLKKSFNFKLISSILKSILGRPIYS